MKDRAAKLNIDLLFLPPYFPNLNIIERLWKFSKKKVVYAKYFSNAKDFHNEIEPFYKEINEKHMEDLKKLMTLNFQIFDKVQGKTTGSTMSDALRCVSTNSM